MYRKKRATATSAYTYPGARACVKSAGLKAVVGKFATVSDPAEPADQRKADGYTVIQGKTIALADWTNCQQ